MKEANMENILESLKSKNTIICKEDLDKLKELPANQNQELVESMSKNQKLNLLRQLSEADSLGSQIQRKKSVCLNPTNFLSTEYPLLSLSKNNSTLPYVHKNSKSIRKMSLVTDNGYTKADEIIRDLFKKILFSLGDNYEPQDIVIDEFFYSIKSWLKQILDIFIYEEDFFLLQKILPYEFKKFKEGNFLKKKVKSFLNPLGSAKKSQPNKDEEIKENLSDEQIEDSWNFSESSFVENINKLSDYDIQQETSLSEERIEFCNKRAMDMTPEQYIEYSSYRPLTLCSRGEKTLYAWIYKNEFIIEYNKIVCEALEFLGFSSKIIMKNVVEKAVRKRNPKNQLIPINNSLELNEVKPLLLFENEKLQKSIIRYRMNSKQFLSFVKYKIYKEKSYKYLIENIDQNSKKCWITISRISNDIKYDISSKTCIKQLFFEWEHLEGNLRKQFSELVRGESEYKFKIKKMNMNIKKRKSKIEFSELYARFLFSEMQGEEIHRNLRFLLFERWKSLSKKELKKYLN